MANSSLRSTRPFVYRGRLRWRVVGVDHLCSTCWRYSPGDIPWCGVSPCRPPRWWQIVRRWRQGRAGDE